MGRLFTAAGTGGARADKLQDSRRRRAALRRMNILALETSTETLSVALCADGACRSRDEAGGARASQRLLPLCRELLAEAGLDLRNVGLIGMGAGPGAFTGLRTAASVAQGLAFGLDIAVAPVDTLLAQAETAFPSLQADGQALPAPITEAAPGGVVLVVNDARMGEVYWELAIAGASGWTALHGPAVHPPEQAVAHWTQALAALPEPGMAEPPLRACGNAWSEHAEALTTALASTVCPAPWADALRRAVAAAVSCTPSAAAVARLALRMHAAGQTVGPEQAQPIYVRDKVALTTAEREIVGGGAGRMPNAR